MTKKELLKRIETLEAQVAMLSAQVAAQRPATWPTRQWHQPWEITCDTNTTLWSAS